MWFICLKWLSRDIPGYANISEDYSYTLLFLKFQIMGMSDNIRGNKHVASLNMRSFVIIE